jgi:hypothetical protein
MTFVPGHCKDVALSTVNLHIYCNSNQILTWALLAVGHSSSIQKRKMDNLDPRKKRWRVAPTHSYGMAVVVVGTGVRGTWV